MATAEADQVIWPEAALAPGGVPGQYAYGELLPAPATDEEAAARGVLRATGVLRRVIAAGTPADLAAAYMAAAQAQTSREAAENASSPPAQPFIPVTGGLPIVAGTVPSG